jgi:hypothetical protein
MITGAHVLLNSSDAEADRAFFRDVMEFSWVDAGHGWLIFKLPLAEAAVHPDGGAAGCTQLYMMCDDLLAEIQTLAAKNVSCSAVTHERWGITTEIRLPSGSTLGLYQPLHPTALTL